jgi:hypothetical protein
MDITRIPGEGGRVRQPEERTESQSQYAIGLLQVVLAKWSDGDVHKAFRDSATASGAAARIAPWSSRSTLPALGGEAAKYLRTS